MDAVNKNRGLLKQISHLCREKNELVKQVNVLKNEKKESLNELHYKNLTVYLLNLPTITIL